MLGILILHFKEHLTNKKYHGYFSVPPVTKKRRFSIGAYQVAKKEIIKVQLEEKADKTKEIMAVKPLVNKEKQDLQMVTKKLHSAINKVATMKRKVGDENDQNNQTDF